MLTSLPGGVEGWPDDPRQTERQHPECRQPADAFGLVETSGSLAPGSGAASRALSAYAGIPARCGALDTSWGDAASSRWTLRVVTCGGDEAEALTIELHEASTRSHLLCCLQDTERWAGDVYLKLPHASWRPAIEPLLRHIYSPQATDYFVETLLLRRTLPEAIGVVHCALYFDVSAAFFPVFYAKVAARRTLLCRSTGDVDSDSFGFPRDHDAEVSWHALPLDHALLWLHALDLSPGATKSNLASYVAADPSLGAAPVEELASRHLELAHARLKALKAERAAAERARALRRRPVLEPGMRVQHHPVVAAPTDDPATAEPIVDATPLPPAAQLHPAEAQPEHMAIAALLQTFLAADALGTATAPTAAQLLQEGVVALAPEEVSPPLHQGAWTGVFSGNTSGGEALAQQLNPQQHLPPLQPAAGHLNAHEVATVSAPESLAATPTESTTAPAAAQPVPPPPAHTVAPLAAPFAMPDTPAILPAPASLPGTVAAPPAAPPPVAPLPLPPAAPVPPPPLPTAPAPPPAAPPAAVPALWVPNRLPRAAPQPDNVDVDDLVAPLDDIPACGSARHLEDLDRRAQEATEDTRRWHAIHQAAQEAGWPAAHAGDVHGAAHTNGGGNGGAGPSGGGQSGPGREGGDFAGGGSSGVGSSGTSTSGPASSDMDLSGDGRSSSDPFGEEQARRSSSRSHFVDPPSDGFWSGREIDPAVSWTRAQMRQAKRLRGEASVSQLSAFREVLRSRTHHILHWARSTMSQDRSDRSDDASEQ